MSSVESQQVRAAESLKEWFQPRRFPYLWYMKPETCSEGIGPLKGRLVLHALHGLGGLAKPKIGVPGVVRDALFSQAVTEEVLLILFSPPLACCYYTDIMVTCFKSSNVIQK